MAFGIQLTVDYAFKQTLGNPDHTDITIHFLNAVLAPQRPIQEVQILNPALPKAADWQKESLLDILAVDDQGRRFNVEMQTTLPYNLRPRLVYYASRLYSGQLQVGENYQALRTAISICVLERPLIITPRKLHHEFRLRDERGTAFCDDFQLHLLQLSHTDASVHNVRERSPLEQWSFLLGNAHCYSTDELRRALPDPVFSEALEIATMIANTPEQQLLYEARLKAQRDEAARLLFSREEGRVQGRDEGIAIGLTSGRLLGQIALLRKILGEQPISDSELKTWSDERLEAECQELQRRWEARSR